MQSALVLPAPEAREVARHESRIREAVVVESHPAYGSVLYLVVVQDPGRGRAHPSQETKDLAVVASLAKIFFVGEVGKRVEGGRGRQDRRGDGLQDRVHGMTHQTQSGHVTSSLFAGVSSSILTIPEFFAVGSRLTSSVAYTPSPGGVVGVGRRTGHSGVDCRADAADDRG